MKAPFSLDPSSRKYICPNCGRKTFVVYLDETRRMLDPTCGRCDRQDKCCYHLPPREFFAQRRTLTPYQGVKFSTSPSHYGKVRNFTPTLLTPDYLESESYLDYMRAGCESSTLYKALLSKFRSWFSDSDFRDSLRDVFRRYMIGAATNGDVIFLQADLQGNIRTGKRMGYDATGHRNGRIQWLHSKRGEGYRLKQSFFGPHLLKDPATVALLFESEKTALVVATLFDIYGMTGLCPIATGGCGGLNPKPDRLGNPYDALAALKGRKVILFPDNGKYEEWSRKGAELQGFADMVTIAPIMEPGLHSLSRYANRLTFETLTLLSDILRALPLGSDLADLIFAFIDGRHPQRHLLAALHHLTCDPVAHS